MANYDSIEEMLNTTENMQHLVVSSSHDDDTMTFAGVDWFMFNGTKAATLYVSGNSWVGLGANSEQLLVCRRDTKMWDFYREEGTLYGTYRVLKIRWEGYAQYNSTSSDVRLVYEWLFFETGDIMLNLIQPPKNSGYLGSNRINGGVNQNFTVTAGVSEYLSLYHEDDAGTVYTMKYELLDINPPYDHRYLLSDKDEKYYRIEHDKAFVDAVSFKGYQCIRTGIIPNQDTKVVISFNASSFGDYALFGTRTSTSADKFGVFLTSATQINGQYGTISTTVDVDNFSGIDVTLELSKEGLKRDEIVIVEYEETSFKAPCELVFGSMNTNGILDTRFFKGDVTKIEVWQGEEQLLDLIPCVDENLQVCFYNTIDETCFYNTGYGKFGFVDSKGKYDEATRLVEVTFDELTAEIILAEGFEDFPRSEVLTRLVNPTLLYWHDSEENLPVLQVDVKAVPPVQTIYSKNTEMLDSTILGIEKVEIEADDTTLFAFSFDCGITWKAFIENAWVNLSETTSGMNQETVEAIGTDAWTIANEKMQYMVRFTIIEGGYVNRVIIHYIN